MKVDAVSHLTDRAQRANSDGSDRKVFFFSVLAALVLGAGVVWLVTKVSSLTAAPVAVESAPPQSLPRPLADFQLTERSGRAVNRDDLAGKFLVVNFVFTGCSLTCLAVNDRMSEIQSATAAMPDVQLVSLSVDPASDTPAALTEFAARFKADAERWWFLTGDKAELYRLIESSFIARPPGGDTRIPGGFAHTDRIMLVDQGGNVCASFNGLKNDVAARVIDEIQMRRRL